MRIHRLTTQTANQIAAGEVIGRPASVVKELIENSIDAQATDIRIDVLQGGIKQIRVQDNGQGIHHDDLALALERHATSKIEKEEDLQRILTLGFRGEALSSISAVSRLKLTSRYQDSEVAYSINNFTDEPIVPIPAAHLFGTTVDIRDLFYNTPARRKFLRKPTTEFQHIIRTIECVALNHFPIGFSLYHNEKEVMNLELANTPDLRINRLKFILGDSFVQSAFHVECSQSGLALNGYITKPSYTRSQPDLQYIFVNNRLVKDKLITHALRKAYHDVLFHGRHPAYVIYLNVDPTLVDVNVHPTKHEVKFRDNHWVYNFVISTIKKSLESLKPGASVSMGEVKKEKNYKDKNVSNYLNTSAFEGRKHTLSPYLELYAPDTSSTASVGSPVLTESSPPIYEKIDQQIDYDKTALLGHAIAQLHETYILAQNEKGLIIVDMHAAHERILYEKMKEELSKTEIATQLLLVPIHLSLNRQEIMAWQDNQTIFLNLGFEIELFDEDKILIRRHPCLLKSSELESLIRDVLSDLSLNEISSRLPEKINTILATIACHAAMRAPHRLTLVEMDALLSQMEKTVHGGLCNHGRPTWKQFYIHELDKFFLRGR